MDTLAIAPVVPATEAHHLATKNPAIRFLDVRTPGEFESEHIGGAYNVPLDTLGEHAAELSSSLSDPVMLVCQSGQRARQAGAMLRQAGMVNLHVLEGGVNAWLAAGLPTVRGTKRMSLERQVRIVAGGLAAIGGVLALVVNPWFAALPAFIGSGLVFSGVTDTCTMAMVLAKLPYNRPPATDVGLMIRELTAGRNLESSA